MSDKQKTVEALLNKAAEAKEAHEALHFSQAALNAANALCSLKTADTIGNK